MSNNPNAESSAGTNPARLTRVLEQTEHVKETVDAAAEELSSVNAAFKQGLVDRGRRPRLNKPSRETRLLKTTFGERPKSFQYVNRGLKAEIRDRRLATPVEKDEAARHAAFDDPLTGLPNRALLRIDWSMDWHRPHGMVGLWP